MALIDRAIKRTLQNEYRRQTLRRAKSASGGSRRAAATGSGGTVSIAGQMFPASGVSARSAASIAVRNVGRPANATFVPENSGGTLRGGTSIVVAAGLGGGGDYIAGNGISIAGSILAVKLLLGMTALQSSGSGLFIDDSIAGDGLDINSTTKTLSVDSTVVRVTRQVATTGALAGGGNLSADRSLSLTLATHSGLNQTSGLAVGEGDGITVSGATVAVDVTDIIDGSAAYGLVESANNIRIGLATNSGMTFNVGLAMGSPSNASVGSVNAVTSTTHSHAVLTSSNVGASPAAAILASNASGQLAVAQLTLYGNLIFTGGNRSVTASNSLTLAPSTDLILDPTGNVQLPVSQQVITSTYSDSVTGILGYRNWETGGNVRQLTIGKIKADELFVRYFTYDEARVNRGEEFWSRSYGYIETEFTLPALNATVDVWVEEAPDIGPAKLFLANNWLMLRQVTVDTGITAMLVWFQVVDADGAGSNDYIQRQDASGGTMARQQWRLRRMSGGVTGATIRASNLLVDFGKPYSVTTPTPGQGVVHLSALDQDGGPFIEVQTFESVLSNVPQFSTRTRMGHLSGYAGSPSGRYGLGTGNDGSLTPSSGFSGALVDQVDGLRLYNTEISMYDSGVRVVNFNKDDGLNLDMDVSEGAVWGRYIRWHPDVDSMNTADSVSMGAYKDGANNVLYLRNTGLNGSTPQLYARVVETGGLNSSLFMSTGRITLSSRSGVGGTLDMLYGATDNRGRILVSANGSAVVASTFHVYENSSAAGTNAGVTIEQNGTGDALLHWLLTGVQRWTMGIDNSDGDKLKIGTSANLGSSTALAISTGTYQADFSGLITAPSLAVNRTGASALLDVHYSGLSARNAPANTAVFIEGVPGTGGLLRVNAAGTSHSNTLAYLVSERVANSAYAFLECVADVDGTPLSMFRVRGDGLVSVFGNVTATGSVTGNNLVATTGGIAVTGDSSFANGVNITGRVGVGGAPQFDDKVTVVGIVAIRPTSGNADLKLLGSGGSGRSYAVFSDTAGNVGIYDGTAFATRLLINSSGKLGLGGEVSPGAWIDLAADVGGVPLFRPTNYGANQYHILARGARGTKASPSQALNGTPLMSLGGLSRTSSGWATDASADITFRATESHTSSARGAKQNFYVTKNGTNTLSLAMELGDDRQFFAPGAYAHQTSAISPNVTIDSAGWMRLYVAPSSIRYKEEIEPLALPEDFFDHLSVISFKYKQPIGHENLTHVGMIAEEVAAVGGEHFITRNDKGQPETIRYDRLPIALVSEVKSLRQRVADLEKQLS